MTDAIASIVVGLLGGLAMFIFGYRARSKIDKAKRSEQRLKAVKTAEDIRDDVVALDDIGLSYRASKWLSDKR